VIIMSRLRILLLAPDCNPDSICGALISYLQAEALAQLHDVTLVVRSPVEDSVRRRQGPFHSVEVIRLPWLEGIYGWTLRRIFKNDYRNQALTAFGYPFSVAFEWGVWRRMRNRIIAGEFDVVLRLLPITAVLPSPFAFFLRNGPIPFVIGPINGGLPWPQGFSQADNQKQWISSLRNLYRFLPFARSTYRDAAAIIAGSSQTYSEFAAYRDKLFFLPENGVSLSLCSDTPRCREPSDKLELIFVGGLVPYKACDLAFRAAAPLLRSDLARFTVVGDGPERNRLEQLASTLGIEKAVTFCGFLSHAETMQRLGLADVLVFPSVREFGGGVVFEALASGVVPLVADFGGPGDIVHPEVGCKVSLTNESDVVSQMGKILANLAQNSDRLERLRQQGTKYARECLSWDAKAQIVTRIMHWAMGRGPKPDLPPPKALSAGIDSNPVKNRAARQSAT
jgi:glycosyltransferase involved in cell wall biosynthesis